MLDCGLVGPSGCLVAWLRVCVLVCLFVCLLGCVLVCMFACLFWWSLCSIGSLLACLLALLLPCWCALLCFGQRCSSDCLLVCSLACMPARRFSDGGILGMPGSGALSSPQGLRKAARDRRIYQRNKSMVYTPDGLISLVLRIHHRPAHTPKRPSSQYCCDFYMILRIHHTRFWSFVGLVYTEKSYFPWFILRRCLF